MQALGYLIWKEFIQLVRDKATLVQMLGVPLVQLIVLTNAATFTIGRASVVVVDQDRSVVSTALRSQLEAGGQFRIVGVTASPAEAERELLAQRASVVLHVPHGFGEELVRWKRTSVQISLNAEEGAVAGLVAGYAQAIIADFARGYTGDIATRTMDVSTRLLFNPTRNYKHYMIPAILVSLITIIGTLITAQNVAREREQGTLEQMNVTPISRTQFLAGKLIPSWLSGMAVFAAGLAAGRFLFDMPVNGPVWVVIAGAGIYLIVALGIGLWISTITRTQQQTMFVAFFILMVYLLMSGMFTPIESMPRWAQMVGAATPVRHFVWVMRSVLVRGAGIEAVWQTLAGLGVAGAAVMALAVRQYRKTSH